SAGECDTTLRAAGECAGAPRPARAPGAATARRGVEREGAPVRRLAAGGRSAVAADVAAIDPHGPRPEDSSVRTDHRGSGRRRAPAPAAVIRLWHSRRSLREQTRLFAERTATN